MVQQLAEVGECLFCAATGSLSPEKYVGEGGSWRAKLLTTCNFWSREVYSVSVRADILSCENYQLYSTTHRAMQHMRVVSSCVMHIQQSHTPLNYCISNGMLLTTPVGQSNK